MLRLNLLLTVTVLLLVLAGEVTAGSSPAALDQPPGIVTAPPAGPVAGDRPGELRARAEHLAIRQAVLPLPADPAAAPCGDMPLLGALSPGPGLDPGRRWDLDDTVPGEAIPPGCIGTAR